MSEKVMNIHDAFLNYMRKNRMPVTIFLLNGVKLTGIISCFDQSSLVLKREGYTQLLYKHAISTFSPHGPIGIFDWNVAPTYQGKRNEIENNEGGSAEEEFDDYDDDEFDNIDEDDEDDS
jgi:host factor-I protein